MSNRKEKYFYRARTKEGRIYEGSVIATSKSEVYKKIQEEGGFAIRVYKDKEKYLSFNYWDQKLSTVPMKEKISFATNLAAMLSAGLTSFRALEILSKQAKSPKLRYTILKIKSLVESGFSLHAAFDKYGKIFPPIFVAMIKAGERSGKLPEALEAIAKQLKNSYEIRSKIKSAMMYPAIIVAAIIIIGIFMMIKVVPTLLGTFEGMNIELPKSTKLVMALSDFMQNHYILIIFATIIFVTGIYYITKNQQTRFIADFILLKIPQINTLYKQINTAYLARTLSSLIDSGVDLLEALEISKDVLPSTYHKKAVKDTIEYVKHGGLISESFRKFDNLFPVMFVEMLAVGEQTGQISHMLDQIAQFYEKEVEQKTKTFSTIIEPILMLVVGIAVGFFAVAMISPIYSVANAI